MSKTSTTEKTIIRTGRGLSIAGTRITLYSIMDYVKAGWPSKLIKDLFDLTDRQIIDVMSYIEMNHDEVEDEYQLVLKKAEENRRYWTEYNREHLKKNAAGPHKPEHEEIWAKLKTWQTELEMA